MSCAVPRTVELFFLWKEQLGGARLKALHDVIWNCIHQLDDVAFPEQFLAELVQSFDLAAAAVRCVCLPTDPRRKLAAHDGGDQKCAESHPILWVGNSECLNWGQELIIEDQHRCHGHKH